MAPLPGVMPFFISFPFHFISYSSILSHTRSFYLISSHTRSFYLISSHFYIIFISLSQDFIFISGELTESLSSGLPIYFYRFFTFCFLFPASFMTPFPVIRLRFRFRPFQFVHSSVQACFRSSVPDRFMTVHYHLNQHSISMYL